MVTDRIRLNEFVALVTEQLGPFQAATQRHQDAGEADFVGDEHELRDLDDWLREFSAYLQYVELQEEEARL